MKCFFSNDFSGSLIFSFLPLCVSVVVLYVCRLLVASMQSICLEALGGENAVDPRLQETTFIQQTFGGRLRSKV